MLIGKIASEKERPFGFDSRIAATFLVSWILMSVGGHGSSVALAEHKQPREKRIERVDRMTDGRLKEYIRERIEGINSSGNFKDYLRDHPNVREEYKKLLLEEMKAGDWASAFVVETAPQKVMLDTFVVSLRPGGELRREFVNEMQNANPDVGNIRSVLEDRSHPDADPDLRLYKEHFSEHPVGQVAPLIEWLTRTDPLLSMDLLLDAYADELEAPQAVFEDHQTIKNTDWRYEHGFLQGYPMPNETADTFRRLSHNDAWWVRLYALSAMRERGPFTIPNIFRDLRDDPNPAVQRAAEAYELPEDR